jgi:hypothetical protein
MSELKAALQITFAVAEAIHEAGEIPEGTIYAALIGKVTLEGFYACLRTLERSGLIKREPCHLVRWVGPGFAD